MQKTFKKIIILGGGAAGYFLAANLNPAFANNCLILEKSKTPLQKVKISGGGRCNVTHSCFEPNYLIDNYPRGSRPLRSVFHRFQPRDTLQWFESRGVKLKTENDGRIFPQSDKSEDIIECLSREASKTANVILSENIHSIEIDEDGLFNLEGEKVQFSCEYLVIATGSNPKVWSQIETFGHKLIPAVPSLFSFVINEEDLHLLSGISFKNTTVKIEGTKYNSTAPLLITHWGLSGPAILKLSSFAARDLFDKKYQANISVNWIALDREKSIKILTQWRLDHEKNQVSLFPPFEFSKRFWSYIIMKSNIQYNKKWQEISQKEIRKIVEYLVNSNYKVEGKSTYKAEFVTAGGVCLNEVDFTRMESKKCPNLFFAGEVLDIDGITGGFNFQACWSEAYVISQHLNSL